MTERQIAVRQKWSIYPTTVDEAREFIERKATRTQAAEAARLIISSYPQNSANMTDQECYATQVVALLMSYPPEIVFQLAKPVDGIVGKSQWLPSVAELKKEADRLIYIARSMVERKDLELKQISERC